MTTESRHNDSPQCTKRLPLTGRESSNLLGGIACHAGQPPNLVKQLLFALAERDRPNALREPRSRAPLASGTRPGRSHTLYPLYGHATGALRRSLHFVIGGGRGLTHSPRIDRSPLPKVRTDQLVEILDKETTSMQAGMAPHRGGERLHSGAVATVPGKWYTPSALAATEEIAVRPGITPSSRGRGAA